MEKAKKRKNSSTTLSDTERIILRDNEIVYLFNLYLKSGKPKREIIPIIISKFKIKKSSVYQIIKNKKP